MKPTRRTQPHRKSTGRQSSGALSAMLRGKPAYLPNPSHSGPQKRSPARTGGLAAQIHRLRNR